MTYGTINVDQVTNSDGVTSGGLYGFKNRIINGAMMIDQRNAGASVTPSSGSTYTIDRFRLTASVASKLSVQQVVDAPTGFAYSAKITVASSYSPAAAEQFFFGTSFEANNIGDLSFGTAAAKTATLSFWVKSSVTGTYSASWTNDANDRSYVQTFTIASADTWEQKTITIVGDTTGTWTNYGNTRNSFLQISLGAGSNFYGTAGSWQSGNLRQTSGSTNFVSQANGATFYITGVQLEKGSTATSFDYRPYGTELALCQRYYQVLTDNSRLSGMAFSASVNPMWWQFSVQMRATPTTISLSGVGTSTVLCGGSNIALTSISSTGGSVSGVFFDANTAGGGTAGFGTQLRLVGSTISAAAEL